MYLLAALTERRNTAHLLASHIIGTPSPQSPARTEAKIFHKFFQFTRSTLFYPIQLANPLTRHRLPNSRFPSRSPLPPLLGDEKKK